MERFFAQVEIEIAADEEDTGGEASAVEIEAVAGGGAWGDPMGRNDQAEGVFVLGELLGPSDGEGTRCEENVYVFILDAFLYVLSAFFYVHPCDQQDACAPQDEEGQNDEQQGCREQKQSPRLQECEHVADDPQDQANHAEPSQSGEEALIEAIGAGAANRDQHVLEKASSAALLYGLRDLLQQRFLRLVRLFFGVPSEWIQLGFLLF